MKKKLTESQCNFFNKTADAAFGNPFSEQSSQLDLNLSIGINHKLSEQQALDSLLHTLRKQFDHLSDSENWKFRDYPKAQQKLLQISWLYYQYRSYQHSFDAFIVQQKQAGDHSLSLPFASALLSEFQKVGFSSQESIKYLALFFQLRRGFYFISQAVHGVSPAMVKLRSQLWQNLFTFQPQWYLDYLCEQMEDFSTLLLGATGTGKSTIALAIGCSGFIPFDQQKGKFKISFTQAFQAINLSQYPASLLESELFGHKKGAFTGAIENHQGIFARCSGYGSVFIDEIGEIDIPTQVKLLTVIQDRIFTPVGDHQQQRFEGRVIAATNQDIIQLRAQQQFRNDLYYRLCSDVIELPSLQQRLQEEPSELSVLTENIVYKIIPNATKDLTAQIIQRIHKNVPPNYHWPGNVRELEQCVRRICLTGNYLAESENQQNIDALTVKGQPSAQQLLQNYCQQLYQQYGSYEAVARITQLDRRTVKKHLLEDSAN